MCVNCTATNKTTIQVSLRDVNRETSGVDIVFKWADVNGQLKILIPVARVN